MNPYGALSQMYQKEMIKAQKKKLIEYSTCNHLIFTVDIYLIQCLFIAYVKPIVKN